MGQAVTVERETERSGEHADRGARPANGETARYAQLTYASSDRGDRPGGWGVQDVAGALGAAERAALTRRVVPRFVPAAPVPAYPDPAQLAALPARVVHAPVAELAPAPDAAAPSAYWHTVPCGTDAHGRPGNVFVHVLLDRSPTGGPPDEPDRRPSGLAAPGCWLRPFGPDAVAAAALRDAPDPPWAPEPGRRAVLDFLFAEQGGAGIATLCLLLDALDAALRGGPPVVLALSAMDRAAVWVATADHLMSAGAARACGWSTYERAAQVRAWPADLQLVAVPAADADALPRGGPGAPGAVVAEDEEVPRSELGGAPRTTRHGSPVAVTPWSVMAFVVLAERAGAEALLARMDAVGAAVPEARHPAWAMAMAVAQAPDLAPDAVPAAREVLEHGSPPQFAVRHPALYAAALDLTAATVDPGAAGAADALRAAAPGARRAVLRDLYLLRSLAELGEDGTSAAAEPTALLGDPDPARPVAAAVHERAGTILRGLHADLADPGSTAAVDAVRRGVAVEELLAAAGGPAAGEHATAGFWDRVVSALRDPGGGPAVTGALGERPGPAVRRALDAAARRRLRDDPAEEGTRLPPALLRLLGVRLPRARDLARRRPDDLQRELAALLTLVDPDPSGAAWVVRVRDLLDGHDSPGRTGELTRLARAADAAGTGGAAASGTASGTVPGTAPGVEAPTRHAAAGDVALLLRHRDHPALYRVALRTLLAAADDEDLDDLVAVVSAPQPAGGDRPRRLVDAARLRRLVARGAHADPAGRDELLGLAGSLLAGAAHADVARTVWRSLLAALLVDGVGRRWAATDPAAGGSGALPGPATWDAGDRLPEVVRHAAARAAGAPDGVPDGGDGNVPDPVVAGALAASPEVGSAALVLAGLTLHLGDTGPGTTPLRSAADPDPEHGPVAELLLAVARRRWRAGTLDEADRDAALRRVRRDRRGPAQEWWSAVIADGADGSDGRADVVGAPGPVPARR